MRHSPNPQTRIQPSRLCLGGASAGLEVGDSPQGDVGCCLLLRRWIGLRVSVFMGAPMRVRGVCLRGGGWLTFGVASLLWFLVWFFCCGMVGRVFVGFLRCFRRRV